jgi:hypothetical protein
MAADIRAGLVSIATILRSTSDTSFNPQNAGENQSIHSDSYVASPSSASALLNSSKIAANAANGGTETIDFILHDPICSGFLSKYCDAHFCSENMRFITEIDRFQDQFHRDKHSWTKKSWRTIDSEIDLQKTVFSDATVFDIDRDFVQNLKDGLLISADLWPSKVITREAIEESILKIWETFLAKDAKYWICTPSSALLNTIRRIKMIHIYGKEVFLEALIDPVKTIQKDIFPRFVNSEECRAMKNALNSLESLPCATSLKLPKPPSVIFTRYQMKEIEKNIVKFTLSDLIDDQILYGEFLKYLEKIVSCENLLCLRAITLFKEAAARANPSSVGPNGGGSPLLSPGQANSAATGGPINVAEEKARAFEYAWVVFRFFIASGSAYEISVSYRKKKDVMRRLADPTYHLFDSIEQSALSALKSHYASYVLTKEYNELNRVVLTRRNSVQVTLPLLPPAAGQSGAGGVKLPPAGGKSGEVVRTSCFAMRK